MSKMTGVTVLIYEEEAQLINNWTLEYPNIETGGDLFGLWQNEREVVVQLAIGPGAKCRRTQTAFFQDEQYLGNVGTYLTIEKGMCNIGEWHSHHSLNLPRPSGGDEQTVWRHMPRLGLQRFLLLIATINNRGDYPIPGFHSFMFTLPGSTGVYRKEMIAARYKLLPGPNPYRARDELVEKLKHGAEMSSTVYTQRDQASNKKERKKKLKKEAKERKKEEKREKEAEKKSKKEAANIEKDNIKRRALIKWPPHDNDRESSNKRGNESDTEKLINPQPATGSPLTRAKHPSTSLVTYVSSDDNETSKYTTHAVETRPRDQTQSAQQKTYI